jgi:hypothetical protein
MLIFGENYGVAAHIRLDVIELVTFTPRQALDQGRLFIPAGSPTIDSRFQQRFLTPTVTCKSCPVSSCEMEVR